MNSVSGPALHYSYVDEFCHVVSSLYTEILTDTENELLRLFQCLSPDIRWRAATLLCRLSQYVALPDRAITDHLLEPLVTYGILCREEDGITNEMLLAVRREKLLAICLANGIRISRSSTKRKMISALDAHTRHQDLFSDLEIYRICRKSEFDVLRLLFFGKLGETFGGFFMRDFREERRQSPINFKQIISSRAQLESLMRLERIREAWRVNPPDDHEPFMVWANQMAQQDFLECTHLNTRFERAKLALARMLEELGKLERACQVYKDITSYQGFSHSLRLLKKLGRPAEARALAENIAIHSATPNMKQYASDFLAGDRPSLRPAVLNTVLKEATTILIPQRSGLGVEADACLHYRKQGFEAAHVENWLVRHLFFTFCQASLPDVRATNTLERFSGEWLDPDVYPKHKNSIERALSKLTNENKLVIFGLLTVQSTITPELVLFKRFIDLASAASLSQLVLEIFPAPRENLSGYPDLLLIAEGKARFIEIKGPGDSFRIEQRAAFLRLGRCGFEVEVVKVAYQT